MDTNRTENKDEHQQNAKIQEQKKKQKELVVPEDKEKNNEKENDAQSHHQSIEESQQQKEEDEQEPSMHQETLPKPAIQLNISTNLPVGLQLISDQKQQSVTLTLGLQTIPKHHYEVEQVIEMQQKSKDNTEYEKKNTVKKITTKNNESLQSNKYLKTIFSHFCKENYISSIKSTLFEDKQKSMEEMHLNKWMVFCKEFQVFSKLCSLKINAKKKSGYETQGVTMEMENSRVKQQTKVKEIKEVEKILGNVFKKATQNHTKMEFHHFVTAVKLLHEQFSQESQQIRSKSCLQFAKMYLYCQNEKVCMHKLANLKFTFGIPQIDYSKAAPTPIIKQKSKSKYNTSETKENENEVSHRKIKGSDSKTMILNPIIKEAKYAMNTNEKVQISTQRKPGSNKIKLTLDQPKNWKKKKDEKVQQVNELLTYLDSTKDDILDSYFKGEKLSSGIQKSK